NSAFCAMVRYAKKRQVANSISTTTNGSLIAKESAKDLATCGLDLIRISIEHVNTKGYKNICNAEITYEGILQNVRTLHDIKKQVNSPLFLLVKITDTGLSKRELDKFKNDFKGICNEVRIDSLMGWADSAKKDFTLGKHPATGMDGVTKIHDQLVCPDPFSKLSVNSNGAVSVCCVDWSHGTVIGDINNNTIEEIWNGEKYREFRKLHISGRKDQIAACAQCQYVNGTPALENLDSYREKLSKIYLAPAGL
ncbi:MAG: SPASM domain-containing protein, partial [Chitinivibrionales bacterium]|nr:SPASM domain-containing protein [Chitinivibrionales bacterium]